MSNTNFCRTIVFDMEYIIAALEARGLKSNAANLEQLITHLQEVASDAAWNALADFNRYGFPETKEEQGEYNPFADMSYLEPVLHSDTCKCGNHTEEM